MTRGGPAKTVDGEVWRGRRHQARAFLKAAHTLEAVWEEGENGNPIVVMIVLAAIAYGDAITAKFAGAVNQKDHSGLVRAVQTALGPRGGGDDAKRQLSRLAEILGEKDVASYGARSGRIAHARKLLEQLTRFVTWADRLLEG
ncbi:hypothetical protein BH11GEM2_BH11GEM2_30590 [soil metagenome]